MAITNDKISLMQAAVKDVDLPGSIKLPDTGSVNGNILNSSSVRYLRAGQGIVLGSNSFTVKSVSNPKELILDQEYKDRMGNRASIDKADFYTDGNLLNLKNCAGKTVFSIDSTGSPLLHNGIVATVTEKEITIDAIRSGLVIITGNEAIVKLQNIEKLGFANTLHRFYLINQNATANGIQLSSETLTGKGTQTARHGTISKQSIATISVLIGKDNEYVVYLNGGVEVAQPTI